VPPHRQDDGRDGNDDHRGREPPGDQIDVDGNTANEFRLPKITTAVPSIGDRTTGLPEEEATQ
jgi:hypothetical protein